MNVVGWVCINSQNISCLAATLLDSHSNSKELTSITYDFHPLVDRTTGDAFVSESSKEVSESLKVFKLVGRL